MELKYDVDAFALKQFIIETLVDAVECAQAQKSSETLTAYANYINSLANTLEKVDSTMKESSVRNGHDR